MPVYLTWIRGCSDCICSEQAQLVKISTRIKSEHLGSGVMRSCEGRSFSTLLTPSPRTCGKLLLLCRFFFYLFVCFGCWKIRLKAQFKVRKWSVVPRVQSLCASSVQVLSMLRDNWNMRTLLRKLDSPGCQAQSQNLRRFRKFWALRLLCITFTRVTD